tara:strand:- start:294 stop:647 length:354 start_codon:yes stop_codon:yes gene_type:complete
MKNYKSLKEKSKVTVRKKKIIDQAEIREVTDETGNILRNHQPERSHEELQIVSKQFDPATGEALEDRAESITVDNIGNQLKTKKEEKARVDSEVADLELLLADLNKINLKKEGQNER